MENNKQSPTQASIQSQIEESKQNLLKLSNEMSFKILQMEKIEKQLIVEEQYYSQLMERQQFLKTAKTRPAEDTLDELSKISERFAAFSTLDDGSIQDQTKPLAYRGGCAWNSCWTCSSNCGGVCSSQCGSSCGKVCRNLSKTGCVHKKERIG